jgi:hypothetical protein
MIQCVQAFQFVVYVRYSRHRRCSQCLLYSEIGMGETWGGLVLEMIERVVKRNKSHND